MATESDTVDGVTLEGDNAIRPGCQAVSLHSYVARMDSEICCA